MTYKKIDELYSELKILKNERDAAILSLINIVDRMGGDTGAMVKWNTNEFLQSITIPELEEQVFEAIRDLEKDSEKRAIYSFYQDIKDNLRLGNGQLNYLAKYLETKGIARNLTDEKDEEAHNQYDPK